MTRKVSLDEIFPKKVMEQDPWYAVLDETQSLDIADISQDLKEAIGRHYEYWDLKKPDIGEQHVLTIIAMSSLEKGDEGFDGEEMKELARRRVRLSLSVELLDNLDTAEGGEGGNGT